MSSSQGGLLGRAINGVQRSAEVLKGGVPLRTWYLHGLVYVHKVVTVESVARPIACRSFPNMVNTGDAVVAFRKGADRRLMVPSFPVLFPRNPQGFLENFPGSFRTTLRPRTQVRGYLNSPLNHLWLHRRSRSA